MEGFFEGNGREEERLLKFENPELDRKVGGLPIPSLTLIEGPNNSGKSVLAQQMAYGALKNGLKVNYITTETSIKSLLYHMKRLQWDVEEYFISGAFRITPLNVAGFEWTPESSKYFLTAIVSFSKKKDYDVVIIDSLTHLVAQAAQDDILSFFSQCRCLVDTLNRVFIMTLHPYAINQELLVRVRAICDGHLNLSIRTFQDKSILTLNVSKLKGASQTSGSFISFEVNPAFGIKVLPFTATRG
ncbi:MAG: ATPase domain-containing protein [Candidatus Hecatellaceae archaeon]